ncbi:sensor histidine kinase [Lysobacter koreensis]|uniref:Sensor histidine kinase n=1 Tax=Lysobacter koreensis TaxID=266122 RepID=A0ABW2YQT1_9GAMM
MRSLQSRLLRARNALVPEDLQLGWMPIFNLGYLVFLVLPLIFAGRGDSVAHAWYPARFGMPAPTLLSVLVFLPLYFAGYRSSGARMLACMLGIAALGYALLPFNPFANTYIVYAAGFAAFLGRALWQRSAWLAGVLVLFLVEILLLRYPLFVFALTAVISVAVFFGNHFFIENNRKRAELKLSHDEVRRLAALAERERIGRDLHDLLGHTLSMVALKSELAGKLLERDPLAARREIDEVGRVARDALSQVRRAVSGIRAAGLAAELASAKLLLESDGVALRYQRADVPLTPELETVFALTLREAVTNIQRHARAQHAQVTLETDGEEAVLRIVDDGRGGALVPGNGLAGMRERIEALGGRLRVDAGSGRGTCIEARLPLPPTAHVATAVAPSH